MYGNQLTVLPQSIGQLAALEKLDASHNALTSLPESIGDWTAMRWLVLSEN
jgi:Leucine-rich repeat (LRR) protein